jgi:hypothetical protein
MERASGTLPDTLVPLAITFVLSTFTDTTC